MNTDSRQIQVPISAAERSEFGRVGVLFGGDSAERAVSLDSGAAVLKALLEANVDAVGIDLTHDAVSQIVDANIDRVFNMLHGVGGEDGRIQGLLHYLKLPYTGSGIQASSLSMDKLRTKQLWQGIGLPTPAFTSLTETSNWQDVLTTLGGKAFVKPVNEGSSIGMGSAASAEELKAAFSKAREYDETVIAESLITGPEFTVAILNGEVLPPIKLETDNQFYDYDAKYISNETRYFCPCELSPEKDQELRALALSAFESLGCKGWGRVDLMSNSDGEFFLLEVNTVPGMTSHSLVPMAAKAAGLSFEGLVVNILKETL